MLNHVGWSTSASDKKSCLLKHSAVKLTVPIFPQVISIFCTCNGFQNASRLPLGRLSHIYIIQTQPYEYVLVYVDSLYVSL